jgi:dipeptidyl aminopeptidase/acylaminoacyl peptidase
MNRGSHEIKKLVPKWDAWVDEFIWAPNSKTLYFASGVTGGEPIYATDIEGTSSDAVARTAQSGEFGGLAVSPNGEVLVASAMKVQTPSTIVALQTHAPSATMSVLSHLNDPLLEELQLAPLEPFWFSGAADTKVEGFIIRPPNFDPAKKYPVKFLMHGGPQTAWGDAWSYRWNAELFAANGYVVVMINRRGSTGYGQKFVDEVSGDWGGKAFVDLMKGLDYAELKYPFIDKTRECALGASYGGFMANWVLTHTDRFKCIVTHDGMYNPQSAYGTTEELWFNEWEFRPTAADGMVEQTKPAHPWDYFDKTNDQDPFRKWSPMLHIKDAHTPTLVIHNQRDYRLDVSEGFQLFTALQRLGVPSRMLYFPDEGHWVLKPQNSELWNETVNDWCDRWTGMNKYAAAGPEKNPVAVSK